jgi:hypothetical protein
MQMPVSSKYSPLKGAKTHLIKFSGALQMGLYRSVQGLSCLNNAVKKETLKLVSPIKLSTL